MRRLTVPPVDRGRWGNSQEVIEHSGFARYVPRARMTHRSSDRVVPAAHPLGAATPPGGRSPVNLVRREDDRYRRTSWTAGHRHYLPAAVGLGRERRQAKRVTGWVEQHAPAWVRLFRPGRTERNSSFRRGVDVIRYQVQVDDRATRPKGRLVGVHPLHHQDKTGHFNPGARLLGPQLPAPQQGHVEVRKLLRVGAIQRDCRNACFGVASHKLKLLAVGARTSKCRFYRATLSRRRPQGHTESPAGVARPSTPRAPTSSGTGLSHPAPEWPR